MTVGVKMVSVNLSDIAGGARSKNGDFVKEMLGVLPYNDSGEGDTRRGKEEGMIAEGGARNVILTG